ncbi:MAG: hypothetical protein V4441_00275 [Pseudomonadota bacterium]
MISLIERPHFDAGTSIEVIMSETPLRHILIYEGIRVFWPSLTVLIPAINSVAGCVETELAA